MLRDDTAEAGRPQREKPNLGRSGVSSGRINNPVAWDVCGGPGSVRASVRGTLDVRNTRRIHHKIERLLAALREAKTAG